MKFLSFSLLLVFAVHSVAGDSKQRERHQQFSIPEELGETLVFDWQGGAWQYDNIGGVFRFVITSSAELETNKLYIQWWRDLEEGKELAYSLAVVEFNEAPEFNFNKVECLNNACSQLRIPAMHAFEGFEQKIEIELVALGRYRVKL